MMQAVLAVERAGVMHKDLLERNFLITAGGSNGVPPAVVMLDFGEAISLSQNSPDLLSNFGSKAACLRKDRVDAYRIMARTVDKKPRRQWIMEMLEACEKEGRDEFARTFWDEMLEIDTKYPYDIF